MFIEGDSHETLTICRNSRGFQASRFREALLAVHDPQPHPRGEAASGRRLQPGQQASEKKPSQKGNQVDVRGPKQERCLRRCGPKRGRGKCATSAAPSLTHWGLTIVSMTLHREQRWGL
jgi:hypothetical protein